MHGPGLVILALVVAFTANAAAQQQGPPRIGYVYPAGAKQGTSVQVTIGGQFLNGVDNVRCTGPGMRATVVEHIKPLTPAQASELRDKVKELMERKFAAARPGPFARRPGATRPASAPSTRAAWTQKDEKLLAEIREKLANFQRRPSSPAIAETVIVQVTLAPNADAGTREIRLQTPTGLTNPLAFCVGLLPETFEADPKGSELRDEANVVLPAILNGRIMPGDRDRFRFKARKGQRLVAAASARELIPYIPDAVPGWFQATLALYDAKGHELSFADDYRFNPDPVLHYVIPWDGEYVLEIRDSIYRGREDFVYRIALGELPFVTGVFPLGVRIGEQAKVELRGWNLPATSLTVDATDKSPGIWQLPLAKVTSIQTSVPLSFDAIADCSEKEPNNHPATAQNVNLPTVINGRIDMAGDWDIYRFEGRAGQSIVAEVIARRLNSPLDSVLKLLDASGKQIAHNDDREDKGAGLTTHHADSYLSVLLPASGAYYLYVGDTQNKGGVEYAYRLRLSTPRPDFALRVAPSCINLRGGQTIPLTVHALRRDGFAEEIALELKNAPAGLIVSGARVPAGQDSVRITLTAPADPLKGPVSIGLVGSASIGGQKVTRHAVPAEDMMQAFAYRHLVPAQEMLVCVNGRGPGRRVAEMIGNSTVKITAGGTVTVPLGIPANTFFGEIQLDLSEPPDGLTVRSTAPSRGGTEMVLQSDPAKIKPGLKGNLIVSVFVMRGPGNQKDKAPAQKRRIPVGTLPAIPFEVVAP